jgi:hypothetical protein
MWQPIAAAPGAKEFPALISASSSTCSDLPPRARAQLGHSVFTGLRAVLVVSHLGAWSYDSRAAAIQRPELRDSR